MKKIIRDTNETKDVAAILAAFEKIEDMGGDKFQLFYDLDGEHPIPKDEALTYMASGKACFIFEADEDGEIKSFANMAGKIKIVLDESCPNGYYAQPMDDFGGSSSSTTESLKLCATEHFKVESDGSVTNFSSSRLDPDPFDIIRDGAVIDEPEKYANHYISTTITTPYGNTEEQVKFVANLMFSSAWKIVDQNDGVTRGIISFVGHLDGGESDGASPVTVRYSIITDKDGETEEVKLILPH